MKLFRNCSGLMHKHKCMVHVASSSSYWTNISQFCFTYIIKYFKCEDYMHCTLLCKYESRFCVSKIHQSMYIFCAIFYWYCVCLWTLTYFPDCFYLDMFGMLCENAKILQSLQLILDTVIIYTIHCSILSLQFNLLVLYSIYTFKILIRL